MCLNTSRYTSVMVDYVPEDDHNLPFYVFFCNEVLPLSRKIYHWFSFSLNPGLPYEVFWPKIFEESDAAWSSRPGLTCLFAMLFCGSQLPFCKEAQIAKCRGPSGENWGFQLIDSLNCQLEACSNCCPCGWGHFGSSSQPSIPENSTWIRIAE